MRGVQRFGHSERERHPNGEGSHGVGQGGSTHFGGAEIEPPPGVPIQQAWIAGRIGIGFIDQVGVGALSTCPTGAALDPGGIAGAPVLTGSPVDPHHGHSLESLEALDVEERPYIWDLGPC